MGRPMPVLPEVPSMMVPPGLRRPDRSASSIIFTAMRSLIELPGLNVSILTSTVASTRPRVILLMRTIGVSPIASRMVSQIFFRTRLASGFTAAVSSFAMDDLPRARRSAFSRSFSLLPHAQRPPHGDELADVIRVVIEDQQQLAEIGLSRSAR